jgi:hypothetical protein
MRKNIFVFLPDGIGLKNFVFTNFKDKSEKFGYSVTYWNNTVFPIKEELGFNEIIIKNAKNHFFSDLCKRGKRRIELKISYLKSQDKNYLAYSIEQSYKGYKNFIKSFITDLIVLFFSSSKGVRALTKLINKLERNTNYYKESFNKLSLNKPSFLFCTNQRPILAVAPILAARDLKIPTATFIFSWDNLPKATLVVEADYYFVWSNFMKEELQKYYPTIKENQIKITGTPQFEPHYNKNLLKPKEIFFNENNLDLNKKYICFSGDDVTTSPYDEYYLQDLAETVESLNKEGYNLGVIYRKCPVDFTEREDKILKKYNDIIYPINPKWENLGSSWNKVMPLKEDLQLLSNTICNSILVINIGSSMVFDSVIHKVPCAYINYNTEKVNTSLWDINKIYKFIHFRSMPSKKAVLWVNKKEDYKLIIKDVLNNNYSLKETKNWFNIITCSPQNNASENFIKEINKIIS